MEAKPQPKSQPSNLALEYDQDIAHLTTFGVPIQTRYYARVGSLEATLSILRLPEVSSMPLLPLGGGSNLLFAKPVFDGLVLHLDFRGRRVLAEDEMQVVVEAQAGENWHSFVCWTVSQGLSGLENLALIPGNVGASPIQNIGAYGVELRDHFVSLDAWDLATGQLQTLDLADCAFGYRDSLFKHSAKGRFLILAVRFRLSKVPLRRLDYGDVRREFETRWPAAQAAGQREVALLADVVADIRRSKLPDPAQIGNAGSFFKNPIVSAATATALRAQFADMPQYPAEGGQVKLAAGWLIEQCGWKGYRIDNDPLAAGIHARQALVLVNPGKATGAALYGLAREVQASVWARFEVALHSEVNIIGAEPLTELTVVRQVD